MELQPSEPPGNAKRKLRAYVDEIARLRSEGYTIRAVHQALIDAGVRVAWATVQREAARLGREQPAVQSRQRADSQPAAQETSAPRQATWQKTSNKAGTDEVERFFAQHNSNPLFQKKARKP